MCSLTRIVGLNIAFIVLCLQSIQAQFAQSIPRTKQGSQTQNTFDLGIGRQRDPQQTVFEQQSPQRPPPLPNNIRPIPTANIPNRDFPSPNLQNPGFVNPNLNKPNINNPNINNPGVNNPNINNRPPPGFRPNGFPRPPFRPFGPPPPGFFGPPGGCSVDRGTKNSGLNVQPGNLTCYSCKLDFRKGDYQWNHTCLGRHNGLNVSDNNLVVCGPNDVYCRAERVEVNGILTQLTRECTSSCHFGCRPRGFGISFEACAKCCQEDACNHMYPVSAAWRSVKPFQQLISYSILGWSFTKILLRKSLL